MNEIMTEKEYVPFGVEIYISNFDKSLEFYRDVLGFKPIRIDPSHNFASFEFHKAIFMIEEKPQQVSPTRGIVMRFIVPEVRTYYDELIKKGVEIYKPLKVADYGSVRFYIKDPDGYELKFAGK